jgi:hypothetical protein
MNPAPTSVASSRSPIHSLDSLAACSLGGEASARPMQEEPKRGPG